MSAKYIYAHGGDVKHFVTLAQETISLSLKQEFLEIKLFKDNKFRMGNSSSAPTQVATPTPPPQETTSVPPPVLTPPTPTTVTSPVPEPAAPTQAKDEPSNNPGTFEDLHKKCKGT